MRLSIKKEQLKSDGKYEHAVEELSWPHIQKVMDNNHKDMMKIMEEGRIEDVNRWKGAITGFRVELGSLLFVYKPEIDWIGTLSFKSNVDEIASCVPKSHELELKEGDIIAEVKIFISKVWDSYGYDGKKTFKELGNVLEKRNNLVTDSTKKESEQLKINYIMESSQYHVIKHANTINFNKIRVSTERIHKRNIHEEVNYKREVLEYCMHNTKTQTLIRESELSNEKDRLWSHIPYNLIQNRVEKILSEMYVGSESEDRFGFTTEEKYVNYHKTDIADVLAIDVIKLVEKGSDFKNPPTGKVIGLALEALCKHKSIIEMISFKSGKDGRISLEAINQKVVNCDIDSNAYKLRVLYERVEYSYMNEAENLGGVLLIVQDTEMLPDFKTKYI